MTRPLIVGVGGTTRDNSATERAMRYCLGVAQAEGAEIIAFAGHDLLLPMYTPDTGARTNEARRLVSLLRRCDGLLIASPGYHGTVSGLVKNALDYAEDLRDDIRPYLDGRAVGCIACAGGWQATGPTLAALRSIVHALRGWPTPIGVGINSALAGAPDSEHATHQQLQLLAQQVVAFARLSQLAKNPEPAPAACAV